MVYLTTNGYPEFQYPRIKAARLTKYFEDIFISEEINVRKPSQSFYKYVLNRLPVSKKSDVLIIGDTQTSDILGGINSGIDTCWYNPKGLTSDLNLTYVVSDLNQLLEIL